MISVLVEYVWLDGYTPEPTLRSKVKVIEIDEKEDGRNPYDPLKLKDIPQWGFDGSSTEQAEGDNSDCLLEPVRLYQSPFEDVRYLVLCEVLNADGSPHASNTRHLVEKERDDGKEANWWFGFEQEFVFTRDGKPVGFPKDGFPRDQGDYYCGVGASNVNSREIVNDHAQDCLYAGISITGTNAEVMIGQWEFQCFGKGALKAADDLWMSRYFLHRATEEHGVTIDTSPKPVKGNWNGNGLHTNFSNLQMREEGGKELFAHLCDLLGIRHVAHIAEYGSKNDERLTGEHETQHISQFSYGVSDRGASIRIPIATVKEGWKGYLEDRRPAANADPYRVVRIIIDTLS